VHEEKLQIKVQLMQVVEDQLQGDAVGEEEGERDLVLGSAFKCDVLVVTCYDTFVTLVMLDL
jgi:hypothetical protein